MKRIIYILTGKMCIRDSLYTVTRNKCLNHLKHEQLDIPDFPDQEKFESGFEAAIIEQETFRIVRKAVEELPTQMRNIILYSCLLYTSPCRRCNNGCRTSTASPCCPAYLHNTACLHLRR